MAVLLGAGAVAATLANATVVIDGGRAARADDKALQDNRGAGGSVTIRDFGGPTAPAATARRGPPAASPCGA